MAIRINGVDKKSTLNTNNYNSSLGNVGDASGYLETQPGKGTYHMAMSSNLYEIQRSNNFEFVVDLGSASTKVYKAGNAEETEYFTGDVMQEVLRMSVSEASIPHFSQNAIEIKRGNTTLKYAGVPSFTEGSLTLNDFIGADTKAMLMAWQNLSYNVKTEKVGIASDYKKQATLIEYSPDLQVVRSWTLYGCWITGITEPNFSSDDNSKHTISVNIAYDKAILNEGL